MEERVPPMEINQHVALDITAEWLDSLKRKAGMSSQQKPPANPTIFRVPPSLRRSNEDDYKPQLISIGPYHHRKSEELKNSENIKLHLLNHYISMVPNGIEEGLRKMRDLEEAARNCYSEVICADREQFRDMLLLDGCFLVQILITLHDPEAQQANGLESLLFNNPLSYQATCRDLLLLENQLPYFIIKHLLDTLSIPGWDNSRLQQAAISLFIIFLPQYSYIGFPELPEQGFEVDHLLHLFHKWISSIPRVEPSNRRSCCQLPSKLLSLMINKTRDCLYKVFLCCSNPSVFEGFPGNIGTMTELAEVGVKIKVKEASSFLDISYCKDKRELRIPAIYVDGFTSFCFANLIAFEQSCLRHGWDVTVYIIFLDDIINNSRDVQLLHQVGIIHRNLDNDEDVASLFNKLGKGLAYDSQRNYLEDVYKGLATYYQSRHRQPKWPKWCAQFALLVLILTVIQSVYTVLAYYK